MYAADQIKYTRLNGSIYRGEMRSRCVNLPAGAIAVSRACFARVLCAFLCCLTCADGIKHRTYTYICSSNRAAHWCVSLYT